MSTNTPVTNLISRVRAGHQDAQAELYRRYEPAVRAAARGGLFNPRLRRLLDEEDVCQSVWKSFFRKGVQSDQSPETSEQMQKFLKKMVRRKVFDHLRRQTAQRRDQGRVEAGDVGGRELACPNPTPSEQVAARELIAAARQELSPEELRLQELRGDGRGWSSVAAEVGGSAEALRKKLERAMTRVRDRLGLGTPSRG